jgi:hypothetical protein
MSNLLQFERSSMPILKDGIVHFGIYIPAEQLEQIKKIAKSHHRSVSSEIVMLIEEHVKREEKRNGKSK